MQHEAILDGSLYVRHDLAGLTERNRAFALSNAARAHFASQLIFYDRVIVSTKDFGILAAIAQWSDTDLVAKLLAGWGDVVAKYPDGTPAIAEGPVGRG